MALQDVLNDFTNILNRDDCTQSQALTFLQQGLRRIQRDCRLPCMERSIIVSPQHGSINWISAPQDLLQPIDLMWLQPDSYWRPLEKKSYRQLVRVNPMDEPKVYARLQSQFWIAGSVPSGSQVMFTYYGNLSPIVALSDDNEVTASAPDLVTYAGLSYAGQTFRSDNASQWETIYQAVKAEVTQMAADLDAEGGPQYVNPLYADRDI